MYQIQTREKKKGSCIQRKLNYLPGVDDTGAFSDNNPKPVKKIDLSEKILEDKRATLTFTDTTVISKQINLNLPDKYNKGRSLKQKKALNTSVEQELNKTYFKPIYIFEFDQEEFKGIIHDSIARKLSLLANESSAGRASPSTGTVFESDEVQYLNIHRDHIIPYQLIVSFVNALYQMDSSNPNNRTVLEARDAWRDAAIDQMKMFVEKNDVLDSKFYGSKVKFADRAEYAKGLLKKYTPGEIEEVLRKLQVYSVESDSEQQKVNLEGILSGMAEDALICEQNLELEQMAQLSEDPDDWNAIFKNSVCWMPGNIFFAWIGSNGAPEGLAKERLNDEHEGLFFDTYYRRVLETLPITDIPEDRAGVTYADFKEAYRGMLDFNSARPDYAQLHKTLEILKRIAQIQEPLVTKSGEVKLNPENQKWEVSGGDWDMSGPTSIIRKRTIPPVAPTSSEPHTPPEAPPIEADASYKIPDE